MEKLTNATERFELNGVTYTQTKTGYCFKSTGLKDKKGQDINRRISKAVFEEAIAEYNKLWEAEIEASRKAREEEQEQSDREAEKAVNGKKATKRTRKSKDIAYTYYESDGNNARAKVLFTLTAKQVDFIKHLPDTGFWEDGLESTLWCDILADEIGGQFAGKPMTVGAMISTLREKDLLSVGKDDSRKGKPSFMKLTEMGQAVAIDLGLR